MSIVDELQDGVSSVYTFGRSGTWAWRIFDAHVW